MIRVSSEKRSHYLALTAGLLLAMLFLFILGTRVMADPGDETVAPEATVDMKFTNPMEDDLDPAVYEYMLSQVREKNPCIDMSQFRILLDTNGDTEHADSVGRNAVWNLSVEYPYSCAATYCTLDFFTEGNNVYFKSISYEYADFDYDLLDAEIAKVMALIEPDMTDLQKVLVVHDYICSHSTYSIENFKAGIYDVASDHSMYGSLVLGTTVCEGFSETFLYFMRELGVECYVVQSPKYDHMWNKVVIDGKAYNVELTQDHRSSFSICSIYHYGFLLSDEQMMELWDDPDAYVQYYGRKLDIPATSKIYKNAFFTYLETAVYCHNGYYYFMGSGKEGNALRRLPYSANLSTDKPEIVVDGLPRFMGNFGDENEENTWHGNILCIKDGRIYFSTTTGVSSVLEDGSDLREEYFVQTEPGKEVYGVQELHGDIVYCIKAGTTWYDMENNVMCNDLEEVLIMTDENLVPHADPTPTEAPTAPETEETEDTSNHVAPETVEPTETKKSKSDKKAKDKDKESGLNMPLIFGLAGGGIAVIVAVIAIVLAVKSKGKKKSE